MNKEETQGALQEVAELHHLGYYLEAQELYEEIKKISNYLTEKHKKERV
mgnify:FL=1|tara:strand:+ start:721 stop:867 length:147 start_codon:yes stop_codon:yes gene_type:complete